MRANFLLAVATIVVIYVVAMPAIVVSQQGWYPLPVVSAPLVQELGKWAVVEAVKKANDKLKFNRVYLFIVDASDDNGDDRKYEAVLAEQVWIDRRILISFNPAGSMSVLSQFRCKIFGRKN
ncbi:hypothetical protein GQ55_9G173900 [Panicum hallii var. hallii]|uniref:Cystatin domain-containing protein n=1 Tax=Panicum hallii var. hallii TaxID=1504633 RepID=A0A2T7C486_9POAL|nr:hypothetical protein GQ55_9G173900 [Panicum hallii var. hallii]